MRTLFVHDHRFRKIENKIYTPGGLSQLVLMRYVESFGPLHVIGRIYKENETKNSYGLIDDPRITFSNFLDHPFATINREVKKAELIIARVPSVSGLLAIIEANRQRKPCIVEVVGFCKTSWHYSGKLSLAIAEPFMTFLMKRLIKKAKYVNYVSRRFLQEEYPTKGKSVGVPDVFLEMPQDKVLENRLKRIQSMNAQTPTFGLIGSLDVDYRGQKTLMNVIKELEKNEIYAKARFLGGGNKERWVSYAKQLGIQDRIFFDGILPPGQKVLEWIDNIDILIMPTKQETLGRAIIEAMSRGCLVIGSLETAIGEQIGSDCLAYSDDCRAHVDIIKRMLEDQDYIEYCAKENFYRAFKYTNAQTDKIRLKFFEMIKKDICK